MGTPEAPVEAGAIAYGNTSLLVHDDGTVWVSVVGCILEADSTIRPIGDAGSLQFDTTVPLVHGMGQAELATAVENALAADWGVTGLSDVKFLPTF